MKTTSPPERNDSRQYALRQKEIPAKQWTGRSGGYHTPDDGANNCTGLRIREPKLKRNYQAQIVLNTCINSDEEPYRALFWAVHWNSIVQSVTSKRIKAMGIVPRIVEGRIRSVLGA